MTQDDQAVPALLWWQQPVPYLENGVIDWTRIEDDLPEPESEPEFCEVRGLDFNQPQPWNLHPYFHHTAVADCVMISHKCNCPRCQGTEGPPRKKSKEQAETATVLVNASPPPMEANPADSFDDKPLVAPAPIYPTQDPPPVETVESSSPLVSWHQVCVVPDSPLLGSPQPVGITVSQNLRTHIETLADTAPIPTAGEKADSKPTQKRRITGKKPGKAVGGQPSADTQAETAKGKPKEGAKAKPKKTPAKAKGAVKPKPNAGDDGDDPKIEPPFSLHYRWQPKEKSQCYMMGTVAGEPKKIITNISVTMSHDFVNLMAILHGDANAGRLRTKGDAVHKRDELINAKRGEVIHADTPAETAADASIAQAEPACSQGKNGIDID